MDYQEFIQKHPELFRNRRMPLQIITDPAVILKWQQDVFQKSGESEQYRDDALIGLVFEDAHFVILRDLVKFPDGTRKGVLRIINQADLAGRQGVVVIPMMGQKVILVRHFRSGTRQEHLEFPRGFGEAGKPPEIQAAIEIQEEIGGKIKELIPVGQMHNNTALEGNLVHLFFAQLSEVGRPQVDEGIQKIVLVTITEFEKLICEGKITDGFTLSAFGIARIKHLI